MNSDKRNPYILRRNFNFFNETISPEDIDVQVNEPKDTLNKEIWDNGRLKKEVRIAMLKIAKAFKEYLKLDTRLKDVIFTGSLANYNWTLVSDIDIHLILDLSSMDEPEEFLAEYIAAKKAVWNENHNIKIKGFEVELYAKDKENLFSSKGIYSVLRDAWIQKPEKYTQDIDEPAIKEKAAVVMNDIDDLQQATDDEEILTKSEKIKERIKKLRQSGLEQGGEFSVENLAFKVLRKLGYLEKLSDIKKGAFDTSLSLAETLDEHEEGSQRPSSIGSNYNEVKVLYSLTKDDFAFVPASLKYWDINTVKAQRWNLLVNFRDEEDYQRQIKSKRFFMILYDDKLYFYKPEYKRLYDNHENIVDSKKMNPTFVYQMNEIIKGTLNSAITESSMKTKTLLKEGKDEAPKKYGCLMLDLNIKNWKEITDKISQEDVYDAPGFEIEDSPHITALFGFIYTETTPEDVKRVTKKILSGKDKVKVKLKEISLFENKDYDVLKFDIDSSDLHKLNEALREKFPYKNDHPDYHPHMTIAYLKPGLGKKYAKKLKKNIVFESDSFVYSYPPNEKYYFNLKKGENTLGVEHGIDDMTEEKVEIIRNFINFVCNRLELQEPVSIYLHKGRDEYIVTTASYVPDENSNHIRCNGRALVDILRSIAHELTHNRQREVESFASGENVQTIGGWIEDEANAKAGILIKDFAMNQGFDEIYDL